VHVHAQAPLDESEEAFSQPALQRSLQLLDLSQASPRFS